MAERTMDDMAEALASETGLVTVATQTAGGRPLLSVVNAGVIDHLTSGEQVVAFAESNCH